MLFDDFDTEVPGEELYTEEYAVMQELEEEEMRGKEQRYLERSGYYE